MRYWMQHGNHTSTSIDQWGKDRTYTALIQSTYSVELADLDDNYAMGKLYCYGLRQWEKDKTYADKYVLVYTKSLHVVGIGTSPQVKQQYKLWKQIHFDYTGEGMFISKCGKYLTRSIMQLTKDML